MTKLDEVPETVRERGWVVVVDEVVAVEGFVGTATFSAFVKGTNIPEVGVDVIKYRTPATLPSFFP